MRRSSKWCVPRVYRVTCLFSPRLKLRVTRRWGELSFDSKTGATLDLVGDTFDNDAFRRGAPWDAPILSGAVPGQDVTLLDVVAMPRGLMSSGPRIQRLRAGHVILGGHIEVTKFDRCKLRTSLLDEWSIFGHVDLVQDADDPTVHGIRYKMPAPYVANLPEGGKIELRCLVGEEHALNRKVIEFSAWWYLHFDTKILLVRSRISSLW